MPCTVFVVVLLLLLLRQLSHFGLDTPSQSQVVQRLTTYITQAPNSMSFEAGQIQGTRVCV